MIDLGKYAFDVWLAYAVSLGLVGGLVVQTVLRARAVKRRLGEAEE
ncbi:heme exporter protein CcmD [Jannaschia sp. Os4]|nr:heme exporter protein CcmD [Jannaschia sp. Os4]MBM2577887.1 heme exporter protein CcmD [Jannaschia sp. Os4]